MPDTRKGGEGLTLYEIDQALLDLADPETGEISDFEELDRLQMSRERKLEGIACWIKDLEAEAKAIREEEQALKQRRESSEKKAESLRSYLARALNGEKFSCPRAAVSYRKSTAVEISDEAGFIQRAEADHPEFLRYKKPEINREAVKKALKSGVRLDGADLEERRNMIIR